MHRAPVVAAAFLGLFLLSSAVRGDNAREAARLFDRARDQEREKNYDEAVKSARQAIELDPSNAQYHGFLGWIGLITNDYAMGMKESAAAAKLANGKNDAFYLFLAGENAYYDQDVSNAIHYFKQALDRGEEALGPQNTVVTKERLDLLSERTYEFEYRIDPKKGKDLKRPDGTFQLPLPSNGRWPFQKRSSVVVIGARAHKIDEVDGNDVINLTPEGTEMIRVRLEVVVQPYSYRARLNRRTRPTTYSALVKPYLGPSEWINPESRILQKAVEPLKKPDSLQTVAEIIKYLRKQLRYIPNENLQNAGDVTAETTLARGQASCHGWSAAFTALCRTAGVPARMVVVLSAKDRDRFEYHDIVEVYIPNCGWVPLEPQPGGVVGMPGTEHIRLYHYLPTRTWLADDPDKMHLFTTFGILQAERRPMYNVKKKLPKD